MVGQNPSKYMVEVYAILLYIMDHKYLEREREREREREK